MNRACATIVLLGRRREIRRDVRGYVRSRTDTRDRDDYLRVSGGTRAARSIVISRDFP
jgi:hypothetical protein